ncbi:S-layer homology domain-containing protein [Paenibacillus sp. J2TS4]|uniref:CAP and S-layer homology domain-containing protein n=1 Tax=Paenibacillus sp. J2TS4 TaxID=2807194 RepID=UPI001BD0ECA5|nr:S-layer homology domain-containing protein [Paenibacillus sp. J2TS4]
MKKLKSARVSFLVMCFVISMALSVKAADSGFTDINETHWAYQAIEWASGNEVVQGYSDGTFRPGDEVTEAEFLTMFIRNFRTVDAGNAGQHWADPIYQIAKENNYPVRSYDVDTYRDTVITRAGIAEIIAAADGTHYTGSNAIQYLLDKKYSSGKTAPTVEGYQGQDSLTRAEAVQFIKNLREQGMEDISPRPREAEPEVKKEEVSEARNKEPHPSDGERSQDRDREIGQEISAADTGAEEGLSEYDHLLLQDGMSPLSSKEQQLADLINEYREELGLPAMQVSKSLTKVARYHVYDSHVNQPSGEDCNLHSWSDKGDWTGGCYTRDHKNASLMWDKPKEITNNSYEGLGFEISYWNSLEATPTNALEGWKKSPGHNDVIIGVDYWSKLRFMGVSVEGNYAHVWFGIEEDPNGYFE